jgi:hypothetical protein
MTKKELAEAIYLFSTLERLLREHGGTGESFSDLVKSFNNYLDDEPQLKADKARADKIGYKFYLDRETGTYEVKDTYAYDHNIDEELAWYAQTKRRYAEYIEYKKKLIGGFYNNLRSIGYERNNLMHKDNYTIENFPRFKKACFQAIDYLEKGKIPIGIVNLHRNDSLRNKLTFMPLDSLSTWIKFLIALPMVYWAVSHYGICSTCSEMFRYALVVLGGYMFFPLLFTVLDFLAFTFRSEENMQGVMTLVFVAGGIYLFFFHTKNHAVTHHALQESRSTKTCQPYYVFAKRLNIRTSASVKAHKKGKLQRGARVCVDDINYGWAHLKKREGWVALKYLSKTPPVERDIANRAKEKTTLISHPQIKSHKQKQTRKNSQKIWHCIAKGKRASGWVERVGLQNAKQGALYQCEIRRQEKEPCRIVSCYEK